MIHCKTCGTPQLPGTLFCGECGDSLLAPVAAEAGTEEAVVLRFHIVNSGRQVRLVCATPLWIGRADPEGGFWPRLDLTQDDGAELGVSRRHALIEPSEDGGLLLTDKHSANGTWLGPERLEPERPYPLPAGAHVYFGRVLVHIYVE